MKYLRAFVTAMFLLLSCSALAWPASPEGQVLAREAQWLDAIRSHDAAMLSTILADGFVHINYLGQIEGKAATLKRIQSAVSYDQHTSGQTVALEGAVAIVHGLNTVKQNGHVLVTLRYTDVYVRRDSAWKAISAQETVVR